MNRTFIIARVVITAFSLAFSTAAFSGNLEAEKAALIKADGAWFATSKSGADFIGYTDPEFTFFPPGAPFMSDKDVMIKHWDSIVSTPRLELVWGPDGAFVSENGDYGHTYGWYTLKTVDDKGAKNVSKGKYLTVMRKQANGEWRPLADIFNAD